MQFFSRLAYQFSQACLDVHVHILELRAPFKTILVNLERNGLKPTHDRFTVGITDHTDGVQHAGVGH